jgi:glycosyltransferase involved in cell wall biosynthesis
MNVIFDGRPITKKNTSGIPEYAKLLFAELVRGKGADENYALFFNSFLKRELPDDLKDLDFGLIQWGISNKIIEVSSRFFRMPKIGRRGDVGVLLRPHFHPLCAAPGVRDIVVFHDLSFVRFPNYFSKKKMIWHWTQDPKGQAQRADRIIAVSRATKEDIISYYGIPEGKVFVVHSGINDFFREKIREEDLEEFRKKNGIIGRYVLFVGTLEPRKNVDGLIRAFSRLKEDVHFRDVKLVIVGARGWLYDTIFKEAATSRFSSDIRMWGHASFEDLRYLYHGATVFAYPSFFEGFGFPPLEAQACDVPVVASSCAAHREILGDSAFLVHPEKDDEIAEALKVVMDDTGKRNELSEKGKKNTRRFQWKRAAEEVRSLIKDTL